MQYIAIGWSFFNFFKYFGKSLKLLISGFTKNCYKIFKNRADAIKTAIKLAAQNDIVVILGKGREEYQEIEGKKLFHSDYKIIKEWQQ